MDIFTKPFYIRSPVFLQQMMTSGYGLVCKLVREGAMFSRMLSELEKSQWFSVNELKELQREKLRSLVAHACRNVPYYQRLFKKLRLTSSDIRDSKDLHKIPVLSKGDVIGNPEDFLAQNVKRHFLRVAFSSGTTGSPLRLYRDMRSINLENAFLHRQYQWSGLAHAARRAVLRSTLIVSARQRKPPFWRYDAFQRSLMVSAYHLSEANVDSYVRAIARFKPEVLDTVPSIGYFFAKLLESKNICLDFKFIFTTSEMLSRERRDFLKNRFKGKMFDYYGLAERACTIGMCEYGAYHVNPEYGITEFLPAASGQPGTFEVVGTGFNNYAMPLLRYRTGDIVRLSSERCVCGRSFDHVKNIEGRTTDKCFITTDGRMLSLLTGVLSLNVRGLLETQFIQEKIGDLLVKVVVTPKYSQADEARLQTSIKKYFGDETCVRIEKVSSIPRSRGGKFKQFVSML